MSILRKGQTLHDRPHEIFYRSRLKVPGDVTRESAFPKGKRTCLSEISFGYCVLLFLFVLISPNVILAAGIEVWPQLETQHFLVIAEPTPYPQPVSLTDWDAILRQYIDQLDVKLATWFGGQTLWASQPTPGQKPILLICANKTSYLQRLGEYGIANPATVSGSGGYYHPDANIILIWRQPTDYYSRHVVLHEVAHWYCLQLLGTRYGKMPLWFCEGLADYAAFHTWDGQSLQAMQLPRVSLENYPARLDALLKQLAHDDANEILSGEIAPENVWRCFEWLQTNRSTDFANAPYNEYALAWGLVAFLMDCFPQEMTWFFGALQQNDMPDSWQSAFDHAERPTWQQFVDWSVAQQLLWHWVWNHWEDTGTHLLGMSDSIALIVQSPTSRSLETVETEEVFQNRLKAPDSVTRESVFLKGKRARSPDISIDGSTTLLRCEVVPLLRGTVIGLIFRYESSDHFELLQFRNVGNDAAAWRHVRFAQKTWDVLSPWQKITAPLTNNATNHGAMLEIRETSSPDGQKLLFLYNDVTVTVQSCQNNDDNNTKVVLPFGLAVQTGVAQFFINPHYCSSQPDW